MWFYSSLSHKVIGSEKWKVNDLKVWKNLNGILTFVSKKENTRKMKDRRKGEERKSTMGAYSKKANIPFPLNSFIQRLKNENFKFYIAG